MGKATATLLNQEGHFVYGIYNTNYKEAERLKRELKNLEVFQCDFSDRNSTSALIQKLRQFKFDGIVNSAGVFIPIDFNNFDMELWEKTFEVNLHAPLLLVQGLKDNLEPAASIVNIASIDGMTGSIVGIAYSATKAALMNLTQSLANILTEKKIRVNAIAPGWIGDGMQSPKEILKEAADYNLLGRNGTYEEVAQLVYFLLSEKSSYINGTTITIDGGEMATSYLLRKEAGM